MPLSYSTVFFLGAASGWVCPALMWAVSGATLTWLVSGPRTAPREEMRQAIRDILEEEKMELVRAP